MNVFPNAVLKPEKARMVHLILVWIFREGPEEGHWSDQRNGTPPCKDRQRAGLCSMEGRGLWGELRSASNGKLGTDSLAGYVEIGQEEMVSS